MDGECGERKSGDGQGGANAAFDGGQHGEDSPSKPPQDSRHLSHGQGRMPPQICGGGGGGSNVAYHKPRQKRKRRNRRMAGDVGDESAEGVHCGGDLSQKECVRIILSSRCFSARERYNLAIFAANARGIQGGWEASAARPQRARPARGDKKTPADESAGAGWPGKRAAKSPFNTLASPAALLAQQSKRHAIFPHRLLPRALRPAEKRIQRRAVKLQIATPQVLE